MNFRERYNRLNLWNKFGAWGSLASIIGIPLSIMLSVYTPVGSVSKQDATSDRLSTVAAPLRDIQRFNLAAILQSPHAIVLDTATDVAIISILDPKALDHRLRDQADWWFEDSEMIREINRGNALFINLGSDGFYQVALHGGGSPATSTKSVAAHLTCDGGELYIGGYFTEGLKSKDGAFGGAVLDCRPGAYRFVVSRRGSILDVTVSEEAHWTPNNFSELPRLE